MKKLLIIIMLLLLPVNAYAFGEEGPSGGVEVINNTNEQTVYDANSTINTAINEQGVIILGTEDGKIHAFLVSNPSYFIAPISIGENVTLVAISSNDLVVTTASGQQTIAGFVPDVVMELINRTEPVAPPQSSGSSSGSSSSSSSSSAPVPAPLPDPPIMELNGEAELTISYADIYIDLGAIAYETELANDVSDNIEVTSNLVQDILGTYQIDYTVSNTGGETSLTRTIQVIDDISPVVSLVGNSSIIITEDELYIEQGITSTDFSTTTTQVTGEVKSIPGTYVLTYAVTDLFGNSASVTRTVEVLEYFSQTIEVDISNGFAETDITLRSVLLTDDSITYYSVGNETIFGSNDSRWIPLPNNLSIDVRNEGLYLHVMVMTSDGEFDVFTSNELPYDNSLPIDESKIIVLVNEEEANIETIISENEILSKELVKIQQNDESTMIIFDLRDNSEYSEMVVNYRIKPETSVIVSANAAEGWTTLIIKSNTVEVLEIANTIELEFIIELLKLDSEEPVITEFSIINTDGELEFNLEVETTSYLKFLILTIPVVLGLLYIKVKK